MNSSTLISVYGFTLCQSWFQDCLTADTVTKRDLPWRWLLSSWPKLQNGVVFISLACGRVWGGGELPWLVIDMRGPLWSVPPLDRWLCLSWATSGTQSQRWRVGGDGKEKKNRQQNSADCRLMTSVTTGKGDLLGIMRGGSSFWI